MSPCARHAQNTPNSGRGFAHPWQVPRCLSHHAGRSLGGISRRSSCRARRRGRALSARAPCRPWPAWRRRTGWPPDWRRCSPAACRSPARRRCGSRRGCPARSRRSAGRARPNAPRPAATILRISVMPPILVTLGWAMSIEPFWNWSWKSCRPAAFSPAAMRVAPAAAHAGEALVVLRRPHRLLEPVEVVGPVGALHLHRLRHAPGAVDVVHDGDVRAPRPRAPP